MNKTSNIIYRPVQKRSHFLDRQENATFLVKGSQVENKNVIKYLGVYFDQGVTFGEHAKKTVGKAEHTVNVLRRLFPRIKRP